MQEAQEKDLDFLARVRRPCGGHMPVALSLSRRRGFKYVRRGLDSRFSGNDMTLKFNEGCVNVYEKKGAM